MFCGYLTINIIGVLDENGKPNEENFKWKTIPEGTATTIAAAFNPSLTDRAGAYLNDSVVANENIAEHSRNPETAVKLWEATEKIVGQAFTF
ncbi:hypothetical protein FB45DRAFT_1020447 [Roridomyces roridus]|uniref:Uncharacterized protein n=1 Tax=Roridomyces roridus TaxID=1738132 RepID=A0AAD7FU40_9AGAR|nr:hypothetical protein FB45DRAFT_1020447 [Roridomyces roridus]